MPNNGDDQNGCFSRHKMKDLRGFADCVKWAREQGMEVEFVDAAIYALERGESLTEAIWFANCEWDL